MYMHIFKNDEVIRQFAGMARFFYGALEKISIIFGAEYLCVITAISHELYKVHFLLLPV